MTLGSFTSVLSIAVLCGVQFLFVSFVWFGKRLMSALCDIGQGELTPVTYWILCPQNPSGHRFGEWHAYLPMHGRIVLEEDCNQTSGAGWSYPQDLCSSLFVWSASPGCQNSGPKMWTSDRSCGNWLRLWGRQQTSSSGLGWWYWAWPGTPRKKSLRSRCLMWRCVTVEGSQYLCKTLSPRCPCDWPYIKILH